MVVLKDSQALLVPKACPCPYPYQGEEYLVGAFAFFPTADVAEKPDFGNEQSAAASEDAFVLTSVYSPEIIMEFSF